MSAAAVSIPPLNFLQLFIFSYGDARIVRYAANATNPAYNPALVPGSQVYADALGNLGVLCGFSYSTSPVPPNPFSGTVYLSANSTATVNGKTSNVPSGRVPFVNFTYQMTSCSSVLAPALPLHLPPHLLSSRSCCAALRRCLSRRAAAPPASCPPRLLHCAPHLVLPSFATVPPLRGLHCIGLPCLACHL